MSSVESLSSDERRAYDLITSRGALTQSELWKELDADSRTGSRLATSLAEKGLIEREEATRNGQRTYLLRPTDEDPEDADRSPRDDEPALSLVRDRGALRVEDLEFSLLMAGEMISPLVPGEEVDPAESDEFTEWILRLPHEG